MKQDFLDKPLSLVQTCSSAINIHWEHQLCPWVDQVRKDLQLIALEAPEQKIVQELMLLMNQ